MSTVLHVKNMVCPRCIETVGRIFRESNFTVESIKLGEIQVNREPESDELEKLTRQLKNTGFELLTD